MEERGWDGGSVKGNMKGIWVRRQKYIGRKFMINKGDNEEWKLDTIHLNKRSVIFFIFKQEST